MRPRYIDRTHTGYEGRIGRICFTINHPDRVLLPMLRVWII